MFGQPYYNNYPTGVSYNPFLSNSYYPNTPHSKRPHYQSYADDHAATERARALAAQRARRHQYLPYGDEDSGDEWEYEQLTPRERAYVEAKQRQDAYERQLQSQRAEEAARERELEDRKWQEALDRKQREDEVIRQRRLEQQRQMLRKKQEEARANAALSETKRHPKESKPAADSRGEKREDDGWVKIPINSARDDARSETTTSSRESSPASASRPPTPKPVYDERHNEAASRIQQAYRIHHSFRKLDEIQTQFHQLVKGFRNPTSIDFQNPGSENGVITVPVSVSDNDDDESTEAMEVDGAAGKLAYTSTNYPIHQYSDSLDKILVSLDGVESWGEKKIRERRRSIVKEVEGEVAKLERCWKNAWMRHLLQEKQSQNDEDDSIRESE